MHAAEHVPALGAARWPVLEQRLAAITDQAQGGAVHAHHVDLVVEHDHGDGRRLEDRGQVGASALQRLLGLDAGCDVAAIRHEGVGAREIVGGDVEHEPAAGSRLSRRNWTSPRSTRPCLGPASASHPGSSSHSVRPTISSLGLPNVPQAKSLA